MCYNAKSVQGAPHKGYRLDFEQIKATSNCKLATNRGLNNRTVVGHHSTKLV